MKRIRATITLTIIFLTAGWIAFHYGWLPIPWSSKAASERDHPSLENAGYDNDLKSIRMMGYLEPVGGIIDINGTPGDRLASLQCAEYLNVEQGHPLAVLESRSLKQHQVEALRAQVQEAIARREVELQAAKVRITMANNGKRKIELQNYEEEFLQEKTKLLRDNLALAGKDNDRLLKLHGSPQPASASNAIVSEQELERQNLVVQRSKSELATAKAELKKLQELRKISADQAKAECDSADASLAPAIAAVPVKSLEEQLQAAEIELAMTEIKAPCHGTILKLFVRPGETISQKPILRMADLDHMAVQTEVYQDDAKRIHLGQKAIITSAAFHPPFDRKGLKGKVVQIGRMVNTPELKSLDPFAKVDRRVIPIRIEIADEEDCREASQFVNLQVDAVIHAMDDAKGDSTIGERKTKDEP